MYIRYAKPVKLYVLSMCKDNDTADDITAETFLKAIKNIEKFNGGKMLTWLCAIAKNTFLDYVKKKDNEVLFLSDEEIGSIEDEKPLTEEKFIERERNIMLYKAMRLLDSEAREVIYLRMFTDLSFRDIGDILGKSENWARVIFYRSKNKLKGAINDEI